MFDYFFDGLYIYRLLSVIILLGGFYSLVKLRVLNEMPGVSYIDHSEGILLLLFPLSVWTWVLWVIGIVLYLDDFVQSWRINHGQPGYKSWIHTNGYWYIQKPVFDWLGIDTQ